MSRRPTAHRGILVSQPPRPRRERCGACGAQDFDQAPGGKMVLVLRLGCCAFAKLCGDCAAKHREAEARHSPRCGRAA